MKLHQTVMGDWASQQGREPGLSTWTSTALVLVVPGSSAALVMPFNLPDPHLQIRNDSISYLYGLNSMTYVQWEIHCGCSSHEK